MDHQTSYSESERLLRRFNLVTGKGGVGKSTIVALLGLYSAKRGRRTLIIELNTDGTVARFLGHESVDGEVRRLDDNLFHVNIRPRKALEEYGVMKLKFRTFFRLVFENPLVRSLVQFVPGMNDLLMLGKAFNHEREVKADGSHAWDTIIVDAPATGHGLTFFKFPKVIRDAVPAGNMHRETDEMWKLMTDTNRTIVHLVVLPEELPVQETIDLHQSLTEDLGLPIGCVFLNQVPTVPFGEAEKNAFLCMEKPSVDIAISKVWDIADMAIKNTERTELYREKLGLLGHKILDVPLVPSNRLDRSELLKLVATLEREKDIS